MNLMKHRSFAWFLEKMVTKFFQDLKVCVNACVCVCVSVSACTRARMPVHIHMQAEVFVYERVCICVCLCALRFLGVCTYLYRTVEARGWC